GEAFRRHGYEGASIVVLCKYTGLGKGNLYHFFRASGIRVGRNHAWIQVEATAVEQDRVTEAGSVAVAARSFLERLNLGVDSFEMGIRSTEDDGVDDTPKVVPQRAARLHHWLHARPRHPIQQPAPLSLGPAT